MEDRASRTAQLVIWEGVTNYLTARRLRGYEFYCVALARLR